MTKGEHPLSMEERGRRGRSKTRWKDRKAADQREQGLDTNMTRGGDSWKRVIKNRDPENHGLTKITKC